MVSFGFYVFTTTHTLLTSFSFFLDVFGKLAGALSVATWVWVAILYVSCHSCIFNKFLTSNSLYYSRRPQSSNPLCRSYAHFTSFLILSAVWIGRFMRNLCPTNGSDPRFSLFYSHRNHDRNSNALGMRCENAL